MRNSDLVEELRDLGLSSYEAKSYVSLTSLGPSEPKKVAKDARIPHTSVYPALESLAEKGWVERVLTKPVTYRAKRPREVNQMVASRMTDTFESLDKIYRTDVLEEAELVYTIRGNERVLAKIYELLRGVRESLVIVAPTMGLEDPKMMELLGEAVARGVRVRAICDEGGLGLIPTGVEIRTGNQVAFDLLVDGSVALIGLPDHSACGWIDSPAVASHFKQFVELLWSTSTPVD
jgi:sugar-specific transcriptional regulator TrmB